MSKTLAGGTPDPHLPRALTQTDSSPKDGQRGVGWVIEVVPKVSSACPQVPLQDY